MAAKLIRLTRIRLEASWAQFEPQRTQALALYDRSQEFYGRRIQRHPLFPLAAGLFSFAWSIAFWAVPLHWLYQDHAETWQKWWWDKGGKWVDNRAFPAYRINFIVLCFVAPYWARYMAQYVAACIVARFLAPSLLRRIPQPKRTHTASVELDTLHDNDEPRLANGHAKGRPRRLSEPAHWQRGRGLGRPALHPRWFIALIIYLAVGIFGLYCWETFDNPTDWRTRPLLDYAVSHPRPQGHGNSEKIFFTALFHNNEAVLPFWIEQTNRLLHYIGTDNVYISVMESWSHDRSPDMLEDWARELTRKGFRHRILTRDKTVVKPNPMQTDQFRIEFLARSRNRVMEPLEEDLGMGGLDRVIFSNDVFIHAEAFVELLNTKDGEYDVACGMDFAHWGLYDNWVTRDRYGDFVSTLYPYLIERSGFEAIERDEPGPVFACWNGILVARGEPFLPPRLRPIGSMSILSNVSLPNVSTSEPLGRGLPTSHPIYGTPDAGKPPREMPALKFRASGPDECFSSECFLLPYDLRRLYGLEKHYINPLVISGYIWDHYWVYKYVYRHWLVQWWVKHVEEGHNVHKAVMTVGNRNIVYSWDGGLCHGMLAYPGGPKKPEEDEKKAVAADDKKDEDGAKKEEAGGQKVVAHDGDELDDANDKPDAAAAHARRSLGNKQWSLDRSRLLDPRDAIEEWREWERGQRRSVRSISDL